MYCPECQKEKETRGIGVCSVCYRSLRDKITVLENKLEEVRKHARNNKKG